MSPIVKVFGCQPLTEGAARTGGRRRKTSKGGNRGKRDEGGSSRTMGICVPRMLRVIEHETIPRRRSGEDARLSERLVRRTVGAVVRFDRTTRYSAERRRWRRRTSEQRECICGIVARALS